MMPRTIREALDFLLEKTQELKTTTDEVLKAELTDQFYDSLLQFGLLVIGQAIMMGIFMYFMRQTIIVVSRLIEYDLRKVIFDHYEKLDTAFYKRNKTGDMMARITEDVTKVRMYLGPAVLYGINLTALCIFVISAMFQANVKLTLYTLLPLPFLSISIYLVSNLINKKSELIQRQLARLNSIAQEVYSGIRVIKSYVKEKLFTDYFHEESNDFRAKSMDMARINSMFYPLMIFLVSLSTLFTVYIGGIQAVNQEVTPGNIAEFIIYVSMLTWPITALGWIASIVQQADASQRRINAFLKVQPEISNPTTNEKRLTGKIEFRNVSFIYPDTGIKALDRVSFTLEKGEKLAILGKTAAGKTTIAELLLRLYDVTSGEILIDDENIETLDLNNLRAKIGYVPQDVFLFSDTVANNVAFGNPDASIELIQEFAKYAAVHEDIKKLSESYETMVGERGITLSGGQKQRISMARAFLKEPDIIILDDSLSAVDTTTENQILGYLDDVLSTKTAIIITHRIYSLLSFNKIIFLENRRIAEMGTHSELMLKQGLYFEMFENQRLIEEKLAE
jgi:ATP-binding cassette subfamily B protein